MDIWFREDVTRILASSYETMRSVIREARCHSEDTEAYQRGYKDALRSVGISFGLIPESNGRIRERW